LRSIIYYCAQKSENLNKKIEVNFFDNEWKIMKNYLEDLLESANDYPSSKKRPDSLLRFQEKRMEYIG